MSRRGKLRIGFTTGSAATAAAKAALVHLLGGLRPERVDIPAPEGRDRLVIKVQWPDVSVDQSVEIQAGTVRAMVYKDAGDDPDVTGHARIDAEVRFTSGKQNVVEVYGGRGVGRITRPGLPVIAGRAAINPGPLRQMERALLETLDHLGATGRVEAVVHVPDGEVLAARTFNPRLGIVGGISILGTRGTVHPFSHASWRKTILQCLDVARAEGRQVAALSTGGRGRKYLRAVLQDCPDVAYVQAGDHVGFAMRAAARRGFAGVVWGGFWGKLVKAAQGRPQTHARLFTADLTALAELAGQWGVEPELKAAAAQANTARHALEILVRSAYFEKVLQEVLGRALKHFRRWAGKDCASGFSLEAILFDYDGQVLMRMGERGQAS